MPESDEDDEKQHEPTQKKLDDARKKGEVAKSADLSTAATYGGMLFVLVGFGAALVSSFGTVLAGLIGQSDRL
ncbi:MAG: EscU/YscU/HrcU family type III secretion system export apparatus switch protein, partial [Halocynthiibacter sp.]